jgi:hypothetical protein
VGNIDYIYQVIQECVDESVEEVLAAWQELSPLNCPHSISTSIATPMQLTSKDGHMVVDFYPVKFHTGQIHGYGYQVTDESMIPQFYNSGMGMAC